MRLSVLGLCLTDEHGLILSHDPLLVILSLAIAVGGSFTALQMIERWRNAQGAVIRVWQLASAAALGGSIWSMHFVGLLALQTGFSLTYASGPTLLSLLIAIAAVGVGLQMLGGRAYGFRVTMAGVVVGLGIAAMHYVGMAGVRFPGTLAYAPGIWGLSLLIGIAAATVALWLSLRVTRNWQRATAALAMGGAICAMHYTGMAATVLQLDPLAQATAGVSPGPLALVISVTVMALITSLLILVMADRRLTAAAEREADSLRRSNALLVDANTELEWGQQQLHAVLDNVTQGICFFDRDMRLQVCNHRFADIYGLAPGAVLPGMTLAEIVDQRVAAGSTPDMTHADYFAAQLQIIAAKEVSETVVTLRNGRIVTTHFQPLTGGGWVATHEDITERERAQAGIAFLARHDALTRLPNRLLLHERLEQAMVMVQRGNQCAVICLDMDDFKSVNDTFGHPIGDGFLQAVAGRLRSCVREDDLIARLGGDEFAIIQLAAGQPGDAESLANRIVAAFQMPFDVAGHQIMAGISIGIAIAPDDGTTSEKLLKNADIALYLAKMESRGGVRFFEPEMDARIQLRRTLELDLRNAIGRQEFELYYQPSIHIDTGRIAGFEALIRWRHPTRGLVSPADFIQICEETGMIVAIGEWVLRTACCEAAHWPADITVAVNLSPVQFKQGNLVDTVRAALAVSGLAPNRLELEITESVLLQDSASTLAALQQLRASGIAVALDDFGTGYSSLSYLRSFRFDRIKIDQSFVRDLLGNRDTMAIVGAVTGMAQSLGIRTTAEGVETRDQLETLRGKGCKEVQGYLFGRPQPASEVPALIGRFHATASSGLPNIAVD